MSSGLRAQRKTLLCIDDHAELLAIYKEFLEVCGYRILTALNGAKAIAVLRDHAVDGVIVDYEMPGLKGTEVAKRIKQQHPGLPVLMLCGDVQRIPKSSLGAIDALVDKCTFPETLLLEIGSLLDKVQNVRTNRRGVQRVVQENRISKRKA